MDALGLRQRVYWERLGRAKSYVAGWLDREVDRPANVRTKKPKQ